MSLSTEHLLQRAAKLDALNAHLTFRISRMAKLLEVEGSQRLADSGVNLTSYRMMLVIDVFDEISVSDLSRIMLIDRAQISRSASELIERGLVEAHADKGSRRKKLLALTRDGRDLYEVLRMQFDDREKALEGMLDADLAAFWRSLNRVSAWLEAEVGGNAQ